MGERPVPEEFNIPTESQETQELSPEVLKMVMDKVQDINTYGTATTSITKATIRDSRPFAYDKINTDRIKAILKNGLLGSRRLYIGDTKKERLEQERQEKNLTSETWKNNVRSHHQSEVNFNIVGRSATMRAEHGRSPRDFGPIHRSTEPSMEYGTDVRLVIDISSFAELEHNDLSGNRDTKGKSHTYRINAPQDKIDFEQDDKGNIGVDEEYGFAASFRVAPRFFKGIIADGKRIKEQVLPSEMEIFKKTPELLLPIYNNDGSLLWPRVMTYDEVKEFVAEKGALKETSLKTS